MYALCTTKLLRICAGIPKTRQKGSCDTRTQIARGSQGYVACLRPKGGLGGIGQDDIFVKLFHDLDDEVKALHEGIDSNT